MSNKYKVFQNGEIINLIVAEEAFMVENFSSGGFSYQKVESATEIRKNRNELLSETDWWALSDNTMTQSQIDYRQALRDITDQAGFPHDVTWPEKP